MIKNKVIDIKNTKSFISNEDLKEINGIDFFVDVRSFEIAIEYNSILILKPRTELEFQWSSIYCSIVEEFNNFLGIWCEVDDIHDQNGKNSALIKIDKFNYVYLGAEIYSFETDEEILNYGKRKAYGKNHSYVMQAIIAMEKDNSVKNLKVIHPRLRLNQ